MSCESSGGSRRLAKINKAPSPSSGSTSSTGSSGGKDKIKKVTDDMAENGSKHETPASKIMMRFCADMINILRISARVTFSIATCFIF